MHGWALKLIEVMSGFVVKISQINPSKAKSRHLELAVEMNYAEYYFFMLF
jgi:hypothetical protein